MNKNKEADRDRRDEIISNAIEELAVHFDSIIIIAAKKDGKETEIYQIPRGSFFEVYGIVKTTCNKYDRDSIEEERSL